MTQQVSAANRKDIRQAEKQAKIDEINRGAVMQRIMADGPGRKYIWDHLSTLGLFDASYYPESHQMYYRQGERNAGLRLLNDVLTFCPELYIQAMREANDRRTVEQQLIDNAIAERSGSADPERGDTRYETDTAADLAAAEAAADGYKHPSAD